MRLDSEEVEREFKNHTRRNQSFDGLISGLDGLFMERISGF